MITTRLRAFGDSIFTEMTRLAATHGAVNLAQGFPDFDGPPALLEAAARALREGHNQYARSMGVPALCKAIAAHQRVRYGIAVDPEREVSVCAGATEAIAASLLGLLEPGDEVLLLEPFYDSYPAVVALAGGVARSLPLRFPSFTLDLEALEALVTKRTRVLLLNTPHNPTGKVFTRAELEGLAALCIEHGLVAICDEVYEHLTFDGTTHVPLASLPGMQERTLTISSAGKTFSCTGWKIGWVSGPAPLVQAAQAAHQFLTFCAPAPLQHAVAHGLTHGFDAYREDLRASYLERRDFLVAELSRLGFDVALPKGTYFVLAAFSRRSSADDRTFARELVERCGVAAIPPSSFYAAAPEEGRRLLRFAFCKKMETLREAMRRLSA